MEIKKLCRALRLRPTPRRKAGPDMGRTMFGFWERMVEMLLDEISALFNQRSIRKMARKTGLTRGKVEGIKNNCSFVLNAELLAALGQLGYKLCLVRMEGER